MPEFTDSIEPQQLAPLQVVASVLRGELESLATLDSARDRAAAMALAAEYRLEPLLCRRLKSDGLWRSTSADLRASLDAAARRECAIEALRCRETHRVLEAVHKAGVHGLVFKGSALAYTHYEAPSLRPRSDTDVLVQAIDRDEAVQVLGVLGYRRRPSVSRDSVHSQLAFDREEGSVQHTIDLHWAISNRPLFARMFSFDELAATARPVPALGDAARTPAPVHALVLACIHRIAHHDDSPNLLWLYDIKLLADRLSRSEWQELWDLVRGKHLVRVCARSLELTAQILGCSSAARAGMMLNDSSAVGPEASAAFLGGAGSRWRSLRLDLAGSVGPLGRVKLLAGHVFPAPDYMKDSYGAAGYFTLTVAYLRRAFKGLWRLIGPLEAVR